MLGPLYLTPPSPFAPLPLPLLTLEQGTSPRHPPRGQQMHCLPGREQTLALKQLPLLPIKSWSPSRSRWFVQLEPFPPSTNGSIPGADRSQRGRLWLIRNRDVWQGQRNPPKAKMFSLSLAALSWCFPASPDPLQQQGHPNPFNPARQHRTCIPSSQPGLHLPCTCHSMVLGVTGELLRTTGSCHPSSCIPIHTNGKTQWNLLGGSAGIKTSAGSKTSEPKSASLKIKASVRKK